MDPNNPAEVMAARSKVYGPLDFSLAQTAKVWGGMLSLHNQTEVNISPELVGLMMGVSKCLRACHTPGGYVADHHVDWTNYLNMADDLQRTRHEMADELQKAKHATANETKELAATLERIDA